MVQKSTLEPQQLPIPSSAETLHVASWHVRHVYPVQCSLHHVGFLFQLLWEQGLCARPFEALVPAVRPLSMKQRNQDKGRNCKAPVRSFHFYQTDPEPSSPREPFGQGPSTLAGAAASFLHFGPLAPCLESCTWTPKVFYSTRTSRGQRAWGTPLALGAFCSMVGGNRSEKNTRYVN